MSNLSAFPYIAERSEGTPGLWNYPFSIISANIAALDSGLTSSSPSGNTFSFLTNIETSGGAHFQFLSVGSTPPSYVTTAAITVRVNSGTSDYLYLTDSAAQKSSYIIGSRAGGLADGLNIWDASAGTMIASFSKQSIRFFQNVTGPVFDVGGSLTRTYNAATFGTGSQSTESRIQAAINQASIDGIPRVYIPANMYPYSASSVSFIHTLQMVREGGNWAAYDVVAYGADPTQVADSRAAMQAAHSTGKVVYYPPGAYSFSSTVSMTAGGIAGEGQNRSYLVSTDTSIANLFACAGAQGVSFTFAGFQIQAPSSKTAGAGIRIDPGVGIITDYAVFQNINFQSLPIGVDFVRADHWKLMCCNFISCTVSGCSINNATNFDSGDNVISDSEFNSNFTIGDGITQVSSNGLKVTGTKFNGMAYGYRAAYTSAGQMSNLGIVGCSFENSSVAAIALTRISGTAAFVNVAISANQIGIVTSGIKADSSASFSELAITGNLFNVLSGGTAVILNNAQDFVVVGNSFTGGLRAATTGVAVVSCTNGRVGPNVYTGLTTANVTETTSTNIAKEMDGLATFTDAATIAIDMAAGVKWEGLLNVAGATRAMGTPTNLWNGAELWITAIQDATGGRAITWPAIYKVTWSDAGNGANKRSTIGFRYDNGNLNQLAAQTPYA